MGERTKGQGQVARAFPCFLVAALLVSGPAARAQSFPPDVVAVLAGENKPAAEITFVGRSGQLYYPENDTWRRTHIGGLASDVIGAVRAGKKLYAVGESAPIFELEGSLWLATPLANRGDCAFSADGAATLASVGRHIYELKGSSWSRFATAARQVTAIYAAGKKRVYLATTLGRLRRTDGTNFAVIQNPLPTTDYVVRLLGAPGGAIYAISKEGVILLVGDRAATPLTLPENLNGFRVHAAGYGSKGEPLLAGELPGPSGSRQSALVELAGNQPKWISDLWPLAAGDHFAVVHRAADNAQVIATFGGDVRVWQPGSAWQERRVSGELPAQAQAAAVDARQKPARAQ